MTDIDTEKELQTKALTLREQATEIIINSPESYTHAEEFAKGLKTLRNKITTYFKPLKEAAYAAHKSITQREKDELQPISEAEDIINAQRRTFLKAEEDKRRTLELKLQREAEEKAEKERQALLKKAEKAEEKGKEGRAEELKGQAEAVYVPPVMVSSTITGNVRKDIRVSVINIKALCAAIGAGNVPDTVIEHKHAQLKAYVKAMGYTGGEIPGVIIEEEIIPITR